MQTPEWQDWKRQHDREQRHQRRVVWFFAIFFGWIVATLVYGSYTGQIDWLQDKACRSEECNVE